MKKNTAAWARDLARKHLETPLPRRWAHTEGVARQARTLAPILGDEANLLEAAAWLHDIGYAPDLVATGFHPLDGARYLRDTHHANDHLCRLVAHHSCALIEARQRNLADALLYDFGPEAPDLSNALAYCDMTTAPNGAPIDSRARISEIKQRYGKKGPVARSIRLAEPSLLKAVCQTQRELEIAHKQQTTESLNVSNNRRE
ncbi:HD domain-containing protein [Actinomadura sp. NPDC048021]|uniref:HD domain-containing protein n=1 Tax=Actinomadura sp. NPDC048021 TaxID=3155385 RepID=UPI0033DD5758